MQLSASFDVVGIILSLLIILIGYIVSSYKQYALLKKIDSKLARLLGDGVNDKGDTNNTDDA